MVEKLQLTRVMASVVLATSVLPANAHEPGSSFQGGPPWMHAARAFARFDANDDGSLTVDEIPEHARQFHTAADSNNDGTVTKAEVAGTVAYRAFSTFDVNQDGVLNEDEVPAPVWTHLSKADRDGTGSISIAEFAAVIETRLGEATSDRKGQSPGGPPWMQSDGISDGPPCMHGRGAPGGPPWGRAAKAFAKFDANGDSALTEDEVPERAWGFISSADSDDDGSVTKAEMAQTVATRVMGFLDADGNGALSEDEFPGPAWAHLSTADTDDDGFVSASEFLSIVKERLANHRGRPRWSRDDAYQSKHGPDDLGKEGAN